MTRQVSFLIDIPLAAASNQQGTRDYLWNEPAGNILIKKINYDWLTNSHGASDIVTTGNYVGGAIVYGYVVIYNQNAVLGVPPIYNADHLAQLDRIALFNAGMREYNPGLFFGNQFDLAFYIYNADATHTADFWFNISIEYDIIPLVAGANNPLPTIKPVQTVKPVQVISRRIQ